MHVEYIPSDEDIATIKGIMGQTDTSKDEYINLMLPLLMEAVMVHTNNNFGMTSQGAMRVPGGVKIYLAKAIERNTMKTGLKSRSMGSVSYSYDTAVPDELKGYLTPYKKVRFRVQR